MPFGFQAYSILIFAFYLILFAVGFANAVAPVWWWKKFESWKATAEPSKTHFLVRRGMGAILTLVAAILALSPTLIAYLDQ